MYAYICKVLQIITMDTLVSKLANDRLLVWQIGHLGIDNNIQNFTIGEQVVVMNSIDRYILSDEPKPGMIGNIDNIMHRYIGQPAEHYEIWVNYNGKRARFELYNVIKYDQVKKYIEEKEENSEK